MLNESPPPSTEVEIATLSQFSIHPRQRRIVFLSVCALFLALLLQGCSWVERFAIFNLKNDAAVISYVLSEETNGFPIFESTPVCYRTTKSGDIDWEHPVVLEDGLPAPEKVFVKLPANCV